MLHLAGEQIEIAVARLGGIALDGGIDRALYARRGGREFAGVVVDGRVEDPLERGESRGFLVLPEVLCDRGDLSADVAIENVGQDGLLDSRHIDGDAGDRARVLAAFTDGDGAAGGIAGLVIGG